MLQCVDTMKNKIWPITDEIGPEKILYVNNPAAGLRAIVVVDNTATGPSIGGVRMAPDVSLHECARLARAMTLKNAAAGLPHGGGKSVIFGDPHADKLARERIIRAFAQATRGIEDYIPGPDMGTNEECMAWIRDETGRAVGLPDVLGGIPLDEIGATGFGLAECIAAAEPLSEVPVEGSRIAVQGFGSVGIHVARFLCQRGAQLVAVADSHGTLENPDGLDVEQLIRHKHDTGSIAGFYSLPLASPEAIIAIDCDIWIPAARPDVIDSTNVHQMRTRLVAQGANIPLTADAEKALHANGVMVLPDFIANAGGVISAFVEYRGGTASQAMSLIADKIRYNTTSICEMSLEKKITLREAGMQLAMARVRQAMALGRWHVAAITATTANDNN